MEGPGTKAFWIAWERHRRSLVLAAAMGLPTRIMLHRGPYVRRVLALGGRTAALLWRERPALVVVQNPSLVLAALAAFLRRPLGYRLVVDRHSNLELQSLRPPYPLRLLFSVLSRYSLRRADLTIVTTPRLQTLVEAAGGRGFVLPDRLPDLGPGREPAPGERTIVFICAFGADEPVADVIEAARLLGDGYRIHVTGNSRKLAPALRDQAPPNLEFTGFLPEPEYVALLARCDVALALTRNRDTLLCGAYEAVSLGRPLVLSAQPALTRYFYQGHVATDNSPASLARAIAEACRERERLVREVAQMREVLDQDWRRRFAELQEIVGAWRPVGATSASRR